MSSAKIIINEIIEKASSTSKIDLPPNVLRFELEYNKKPDLDAERKRLCDYMKGDNFELFPVHKDISNILVLQFPDVERTVSRRGQFVVASELTERLELRSCVPEGASNFPVDVAQDEQDAEGAIVDAVLDRTCWSAPSRELPLDWVVDHLNARGAWEKTRGAGTRIAQPDTGIAQHRAIENALALGMALDVFTGQRGQATDPLDPGMGNPGHGTATSSVIASPYADIVCGIAPKAELVPIRCINSVIFALDGSLIARAIMHAREIEADVISLSLGGPFLSKSIARALELAVDAGIIVVAAAGNCCGFVVYPANDRNAIAVAGVGCEGNAWKGTSRGSDVDIAAPSENVFAARCLTKDDGQEAVDPSQGTSFGTALTAGVAALWVSHHGRKAIRDRAAALGISVNNLFRTALRQTAHRPAEGWDFHIGAGIVDATALLTLSVDDIRPVTEPLTAAEPSSTLGRHALIAKLAQGGETIEGFDWGRYGAEAVFLSTESLAKSRADLASITESASKPEPSLALAQARVPGMLREVLDRLDYAPAVSLPTPWIAKERSSSVLGGITPGGGLEDLQAVRGRRKAIEARVRGVAGEAGLEGLHARNERILSELNLRNSDPLAAKEREEVLKNGLEAYRLIERGEDPLRLPLDLRFGIESLVRLTERPAFKVINNGISEEDPLFRDGAWGPLLIEQPVLTTTTRAVGRINLNDRHIGTGFVVDDNMIMTNRHVLEAVGEEVVSARGRKWVFPYGTPSIDFSEQGVAGPSFDIIDVAFAGPDATRGRVNFRTLDLALLKVKAGAGFPGSLRVLKAPALVGADTKLFVIGYPAIPGASAFVDPSTGKYNREISKRLARLFGVDYGRKYLSPGVLTTSSGGLGQRDARRWIMVHDATTLGGNSGSLVVAIQGNGEVVGLHFAGAPLSGNFAHDLTRVDLNHLGGIQQMMAGDHSYPRQSVGLQRADGGLQALVVEGAKPAPAGPLQAILWHSRHLCRIDIETTEGSIGSGTGFLVGPDLVLTNYHVVGELPPARIKCRFDYADMGSDSVEFGTTISVLRILKTRRHSVSEGAGEYATSSIDHPKEDELDYALLQLQQPIGNEAYKTRGVESARGWIHLPRNKPDTHPKSLVYILQHPLGQPIAIADGPRAVAQPATTRIRYLTPTLAGSSGSPCFQFPADGAAEPVIVAVHNYGEPHWPKGKKSEFNHGVPIELIARDIKNSGHDLPLYPPPTPPPLPPSQEIPLWQIVAAAGAALVAVLAIAYVIKYYFGTTRSLQTSEVVEQFREIVRAQPTSFTHADANGSAVQRFAQGWMLAHFKENTLYAIRRSSPLEWKRITDNYVKGADPECDDEKGVAIIRLGFCWYWKQLGVEEAPKFLGPPIESETRAYIQFQEYGSDRLIYGLPAAKTNSSDSEFHTVAGVYFLDFHNASQGKGEIKIVSEATVESNPYCSANWYPASKDKKLPNLLKQLVSNGTCNSAVSPDEFIKPKPTIRLY
jgi:serine protease